MEIIVNTKEITDGIRAELLEVVNQERCIVQYGEYLTTKQAREYLGGISINTLNKLRKQGLQRVTIDGLCLYKKTDICEFLDEHRR